MTYVPWIRVVVKSCYDIIVPSLTESLYQVEMKVQ